MNPHFATLFRVSGLLLLALCGCMTSSPSRSPQEDPLGAEVMPPARSLWALEAGRATISDNHTHSPLRGRFQRTTGPGSGVIYKLTATRTLHEATWKIGDSEFHPLLELPITAELIDERSSPSFLAYSVVFGIRWVDFPWNDWVSTNIASGGGFHFTTNEIQVDRDRQSGHRSPVKFHWPISISFALPQAPEYQVTVFNDHSSGGTLFDSGGFDRWGIGFRVTF